MGKLNLTNNTFKLTEVGLEIEGEPDFEEWMDYGQSLKQLEGTARQFAIGDWIVAGFSRYQHGKWEAVQQVWGEEDKELLRKYERVSKTIECGKRFPHLSWSHHLEVISIKKLGTNKKGKLCFTDEADEEVIKELLSRTYEKNLSVRQLEDLVSQHKRRQQEAIRLANEPEKFAIILADPAWDYDFSKSESREVDNQYIPSSLSGMKELKVPSADNCVLFMWATSPKLVEAVSLLQAWGFEYKTCMVWVKDKIGMGYYARQIHELVLIGAKGSLQLPDESIRPESVFYAPRGEHSEKPEILYSIIETMYPTFNKLEMFARSKREGWKVWGDEVNDADTPE